MAEEKRDYTPEEKREVLAFVLASAYFLDKKIPEHWKFMEEESILNFIEENKWKPFEDQDKELVYSNIKRLAKDFMNYGQFCLAEKANIVIKLTDEDK